MLITGDAIVTTATLTVDKIVINDNGGTAATSTFPLFIDGMSVLSGVASTTSVGLHTVSETNQAGYTGTIGGDCAADGTITLVAGENKTCTITNDDIPPTLTIIKTTTGGGGTFNFTVTRDGDTPVPAGGPADGGVGDSDVPTEIVQLNLTAGHYTVTETAQTGWDFNSAQCTGGAHPNTTVLANSAEFTAGIGESWICTFTNTKRGSITVIKEVVAPDGTTSVSDHHVFQVKLDDGTEETFSDNSSRDYENLIPGTYTITEIGDPDFDLLRISSADDENASNGAPVVVTAGQNTEVTITNAQRQGHITVIKHVDNSHGLGQSDASAFTITLSGDSSNISPNDFSGSEDGTLVALDPGTYTVGELGPSGYVAVYSGACDENGEVSISSNGSGATCTITNKDLPDGEAALVVTKSVTNDNGGEANSTDFSLFIDDGEVTGGEANFLEPDSYTVSEVIPEGLIGKYTQIDINCTEDGQPISNDNGAITISAGHVYRCSITNDDLPGTLHIIKNLINDNGGTAVASDFSFSLNGGESMAFESDGQNDIAVSAGTYSVTETATSTYAASYSEECTNVQIANGGEATCTITNDDIPAPIITAETTASSTETSITTTWTTDHPATSRVIYDTVSHAVLGAAPNYGYANSTIEDSALVTDHSVTIIDLSPGTEYFFRTISHGSPEAVSDEFSGTTSNSAPPKKEVAVHRTQGQFVRPIGQVLGAFSGNNNEEIERIRLQLIELIRQLIALLQAELDAQTP